MKKIRFFILILMLCCISSKTFSQNTMEIKGKDKTYIQTETPKIFEIYNKENKFKHSTPSYLTYEVAPPIAIKNKLGLQDIVYHTFVPFLQNIRIA